MYNYPITVVIADDHECYLDGLKWMLKKNAKQSIRVIGQAPNGKALIDLVLAKRPRVVLTDIKMPVMDGIQATRCISREASDTAVISLTGLEEEQLVFEMFDAGAKGYLLKNAPHHEIIQAVESAANGEIYYSPSTSRALFRRLAASRHNHRSSQAVSFTEKETRILRHICFETCQQKVASDLNLSVRSIEDYYHKLKEKIGVKTRVGLALYAVKNHFVTIEELFPN